MKSFPSAAPIIIEETDFSESVVFEARLFRNRTVSHSTLCIFTGTMPIHVKSELRTKNYEIGKTRSQEPYNTRLRSRCATKVLAERSKRIEQQVEEKWREECLYYRRNQEAIR